MFINPYSLPVWFHLNVVFGYKAFFAILLSLVPIFVIGHIQYLIREINNSYLSS